MNIQRLNSILTHKETNLTDLRDDLVELVANHPYSGPFRMLLAKASKDAGHLDQKQDLLAAAAHCNSRKALFELMFGEDLRREAREIHKVIETEDEVSEDELLELVWHLDERKLDDESEHISSEREAVVEAIASSLSVEMESWDEKEPLKGGELEKNSNYFSQSKRSESELEKDTVLHRELNEIKGAGEANSLFGKWLKIRAIETAFGDYGNLISQVEQGASAIIDSFLNKNNPSIGPVRDIDTPVEEWASKGLQYDPSLVTETMAKLYASQGQIGRARKAFKMLALKYPEKSVYFAFQLKKLSKN
ncbi:hypothetical protein N9C00_02720 [Flavobacteriales bacterium]|nr:hypothetical protein [Flavobacteriales bacterium]